MIETADNLARDYQISREDSDAYAAESHKRAAAAWADGKFDDEVVPVSVAQKKGDPIVFRMDEGVRADATAESLGKLRPIEKDGVVTAGNASQQNDAAAACLVVSEDKLAELNLEPMGWFVSWALAGCEPSRMGIGPVPAVKRLFERTGLGWDDIDLVELNEAFAPQVLAVLKGWGWDDRDRLNVNGSGISLGHPDRRDRRAHPCQPAARAAAPGRQIWPRDHVHRRRPGHRRDLRAGVTALALDLETREQLIDTVRRFVAERLRPLEAKVAEDDAMPADLLDEMKGLGLCTGFRVPEEYGGLDISPWRTSAWWLRGTRGAPAPPSRSTFGTNVGIGGQGPRRCSGPRTRSRSTCRGHRFRRDHPPRFALTEPEAGSDSANVADPPRSPLDWRPPYRSGDGSKRFHHQRQQGRPLHAVHGAQRSGQARRGRRFRPSWWNAICRAFPGVGKPEKKMVASRAPTSATWSSTMSGCRAENRLGREARGLQGRHAHQVLDRGQPAHLGGLHRRRRAADQGLRGLHVRAPAVRPAAVQLPAAAGG